MGRTAAGCCKWWWGAEAGYRVGVEMFCRLRLCVFANIKPVPLHFEPLTFSFPRGGVSAVTAATSAGPAASKLQHDRQTDTTQS